VFQFLSPANLCQDSSLLMRRCGYDCQRNTPVLCVCSRINVLLISQNPGNRHTLGLPTLQTLESSPAVWLARFCIPPSPTNMTIVCLHNWVPIHIPSPPFPPNCWLGMCNVRIEVVFGHTPNNAASITRQLTACLAENVFVRILGG